MLRHRPANAQPDRRRPSPAATPRRAVAGCAIRAPAPSTKRTVKPTTAPRFAQVCDPRPVTDQQTHSQADGAPPRAPPRRGVAGCAIRAPPPTSNAQPGRRRPASLKCAIRAPAPSTKRTVKPTAPWSLRCAIRAPPPSTKRTAEPSVAMATARRRSTALNRSASDSLERRQEHARAGRPADGQSADVAQPTLETLPYCGQFLGDRNPEHVSSHEVIAMGDPVPQPPHRRPILAE